MKRKTMYLLFLLVFGYLALLYNREPLRYLFLFFLLAPMCLQLWLFAVVRKTEIYSALPDGFFKRGEELEASLKLINRSRFPILCVRSTIRIQDVRRRRGTRVCIETFADGRSTHEERYAETALHCGCFVWSVTEIRMYDYFHLFCRKKKQSQNQEVQILPRIFFINLDVSGIPAYTESESSEYEEQRRGEDDSEVFQIREYQDGDTMHRIHWKMTAREGKWMVKEYGYVPGAHLLLILDFSVPPGGETMQEEAMDAFLELACSLSFSLLELGCMHQIAWYDGEEQIRRVFVRTETDFYECLHMLLRTVFDEKRIDWKEAYERTYPGQCPESVFVLDSELRLWKEEKLHTDFSVLSWEERETQRIQL